MVTLKHYAVIFVLAINNGLILQYGNTGTPSNHSVRWAFPITFNSFHNVFTCGYLDNADMRLQGFSILPNLSDLASVLVRTDAAAPSLNMFCIGF